MMKKSLIALAIAAAAPAAFAATSNVDVYGQARISISDATKGQGYQVSSETSRIGMKGSEDLGGGLAAVWGLEWGVDLGSSSGTNASANSNSMLSARNQFVGLKGAFGTVLAGTHDTPYKLGGSADVFGDTRADSQINTSGIIGRNGLDNRAGNAVAYISPDYAGFHVGVAAVAQETGATTANAATSAVLVYVNGPLKATLANEKFNGAQRGTKLNVAYKMGDISLGYTHEDSKVSPTAAKDKADLMSITYGMGNITLAAQYGKFNDADDSANTIGSVAQAGGDVTRTTAGVVYNLSKRTNVAVAYNIDDATDAASDKKTTTVQLNHSF